MSTIYRQYRPQNFEELVGQNHIRTTLQYEIESGRIAHAYLFCGPRGIGKTTIARVFAKAVNCLNRNEGESEPCNTCEACESITLGKHLDIIEIDAASHTGVDNVRENVINNSRISSSNARYKVFIIDEVHMLSVSAFNALLKVLEEPPKNVIFILATTEVHKIPGTIISRCQRFDFKRINVVDVVKKLKYISSQEKIEVERDVLENIARQSEGHMRDAESLLGQIIAIANTDSTGKKRVSKTDADLVIPRSDFNEAIRLINLLLKKDAGSAIELVNKLLDEGIDLKRFLSDIVELLRKIMLAKISSSLSDRLGLELGEAAELEINKIVKEIEIQKVIVMIDKIMEAKNEMKHNFIIQMPMEIAIIELCEGVEKNILQQAKPSVNNVPPFSHRPIANNPIKFQPTQRNIVSNTKGDQNKIEKIISNINIDKNSLMSKWNEVLIGVKTHNHSLGFILRACEPKGVQNGILTMVFKYKFHKERVEDPGVRSVVEGVLKQVYNASIAIEAVIDESLDINNLQNGEADNNAVLQDNKSTIDFDSENIPADLSDSPQNNSEKTVGGDDNMLNNLLKTFGGKVIN